MPHQRWFGGKGREWADVSEDGLLPRPRRTRCCRCTACAVTYADGASETYLVPLSWRDHPVDELASALRRRRRRTTDGETYAYDAMRDRDATRPG